MGDTMGTVHNKRYIVRAENYSRESPYVCMHQLFVFYQFFCIYSKGF